MRAMLRRHRRPRPAGFDLACNRPVPDYARTLDGAVRGLRIGMPREYFVEGMDREVEQAVRAAVRVAGAARARRSRRCRCRTPSTRSRPTT